MADLDDLTNESIDDTSSTDTTNTSEDTTNTTVDGGSSGDSSDSEELDTSTDENGNSDETDEEVESDSSDDTETPYYYQTYIFKSDKGFWTCTFATLLEYKNNYINKFTNYAKTIEFY